MLTIYRRHVKSCPHKRRDQRNCKCPLWVDGMLRGSEIRSSVGRLLGERGSITSWTRANEIVHAWEAQGAIKIEAARLEPTIKEACRRFISDAESRNLAEGTLRKMRALSRQFEDFFSRVGLRFPSQITLDLTREFRESWKDAPISASKKLERLRTAYRFFVDSGWMAENHATKIKAPKIVEPPVLPFSDDEMARILGAAKMLDGEAERRGDSRGPEVYAFVLTMRYGGLRIGDATMLHRRTLDVVDQRLRLRTDKTGTDVMVPIPSFMVQALLAVEKPSGCFFCRKTERADSASDFWRKRKLDKLWALAGVEDGHPHRFRHTFACSLLSAGVPLGVVSKLLGHASEKVTEKHYGAWVKARQDAADEAVRRALGEWIQPAANRPKVM